MTHHTAAYTALTVAVSANFDVPAIADSVISIRNGHFFLERPLDLIYAAALGDDMTRARLDSPTIRNITRPFTNPVGNAVIPGTEPRVANYVPQPFRIPADEELAYEFTEASVGGSQLTGVIGLMSDKRAVPAGEIFTIRATSTTTAVANVWTDIAPLTFDNSLRSGTYAVVGMVTYSANQIASRLNFQSVDGQKERPGGIGGIAEDVMIHPIFRMGRLGIWGEFTNVILPTVEVLANAGDAVHTVYIDIVKIR